LDGADFGHHHPALPRIFADVCLSSWHDAVRETVTIVHGNEAFFMGTELAVKNSRPVED
jgi:hypothetical protein